MELYRKYRPTELKEVVGQKDAVSVLYGWVKNKTVPHAILLDGPTGVGKSTLARIVAKELGADSQFMCRELNVSADRGMEMVDALSEDLQGNIFGGNRVWILEEAQGITKFGQGSLLKLVEDAPDYAYFIFCTMEPDKLIPALRGRCASVHLKKLGARELRDIISDVLGKENRTIEESVIDKVIAGSDGSARQALMLLEKCLAVTTTEEMVSAIGTYCDLSESGGYHPFWKALFHRKDSTWEEVVSEFDKLTDSPEKIRRVTLAAFATLLKRGGYGRLTPSVIADLMRFYVYNLDDCGKDGLVLALYDTWSRAHAIWNAR